MTQQSLAEQLYVTRQSVSRWECGDRYPDLITTTKIAQILAVSLDDLLSGKEMEKVVERNPVVENKTANNIMTALYAVTLLALTLPFIDALLTQSITPDSFKGNILALIATVLKIIIFTYGLINAIKGSLSPKRMGAVIGAFFLSNCIANSNALVVLFSQITLSKIQPGDLLKIIGFSAFSLLPGICGAIAVACVVLAIIVIRTISKTTERDLIYREARKGHDRIKGKEGRIFSVELLIGLMIPTVYIAFMLLGELIRN